MGTKTVEILVKMTMTVDDDYPFPDGKTCGVGFATAYDNMRSLAELIANWAPADCWILEGEPRRHAIGGGRRVGGEITALDVEADGYACWDIDFNEPITGITIQVVEAP